MAQVKTGISLDAELFEAAERLAHELNLSRSALYARALEELIQRRRSSQLLDELNAAYGWSPDPEDEALLDGIRRHNRQRSTWPRLSHDSWEERLPLRHAGDHQRQRSSSHPYNLT